MTRIAFLGLGGVGGYFGAKASRPRSATHRMTTIPAAEVIFLAREKTAQAIRENGIRLVTPEEEFTAHPHEVVTAGEKTAPVDYLIVSVKSYDLESSLRDFHSCVGPQTVLLTLLNGVDAYARVKAMFPQNEIWNGCVYIVSRVTAPGVITETGNIHEFHFGQQAAVDTEATSEQARARVEELFRILKSVHDDVFLHENIRDVVWKKFIFISTIASLTSYLDVCLGKILEHENSRRMLETLLHEICSVARAEKVLLAEDIISTTLGKMGKLPYETTSSMHSDFQRCGKTEYLSLTAHVVKLAENHRISVPEYRNVLRGLETRSSFGNS